MAEGDSTETGLQEKPKLLLIIIIIIIIIIINFIEGPKPKGLWNRVYASPIEN